MPLPVTREMGILGTQVWGKDEVPFFASQGHHVPPRLAKVVRARCVAFAAPAACDADSW